MRVCFVLLGLVCVACASSPQGPFTEHFRKWLSDHDYDEQDLSRANVNAAYSYGGKTDDSDEVVNYPVIFIHGNSDSALLSSATATGWTNSIGYFLSKGYKSSELYAISWGDTSVMEASLRTHDCKTLIRLRKFVEAVLTYTGSRKVSFVTHSMGVTLGRKLIKGGKMEATDGACDLGKPLTNSVNAFLGLAGANYGLCNCVGGTALVQPTCNKQDGLWPGDMCGFNYLTCGLPAYAMPCSGASTYASFLMEMNTDGIREGSHVFAAWSLADDVIMYNDRSWGRPTSSIPNVSENNQKVYLTHTHMQTKEDTAADQYAMIHDLNKPE